jgi:uncharacterized protein YaaR (DUF327 family)
MGIKPISDKPSNPVSGKVSRKQGASKQFKDLLNKSDDADDNGRLQELYDNVEVAAGNLIESTALETLKEYRKRVKEFLQQVLSQSREIRRINSGINDDPLVVIRIIDEKMDQLAAIVIGEEIESGRVAKMIDEIKGILVDLYR